MTLLGSEKRPSGDLAPEKQVRQDRRDGRLKMRDQKDPIVRVLPHLLGQALSPLSDRMDQQASDESLLYPSLIVSWDLRQVIRTWLWPLLGQNLSPLATYRGPSVS